jgi:phenylpropionate dioxygenase-like ring-hydroxylating dioxygenase large terminal subunit
MEDGMPALESFDVGTGPLLPDAAIATTGNVELSTYYSEQRFEQERELFGRIWLNLAESAEVPNPGDWVVREVAIRSASVILVRGKDRKIRAFHNICSHRGMKLVWDTKGRGGKFSCPYHAWIYDSSGELVNIPDEGCFQHVDKKESGLTPIACEEYEGLIFINLDPNCTQSLEEFLGPVADRISGLPFASYPHAVRFRSELACNWKLAIEAQCESYHVTALHGRTVSKFLAGRDNPFAHTFDMQLLGPHAVQSTPRNPDFAFAERNRVQYFAFAHAAHMVVKNSGQTQALFTNDPRINRTGSDVWANDQYTIFPNVILNIGSGGWYLLRYWPVAPGRTLFEGVNRFEEPRSLRSRFGVTYSFALNRDVLMEDNVAMMQQQQVMASGGKTWCRYGEQELLCKHLAAVTQAAIDEAETPLLNAAE